MQFDFQVMNVDGYEYSHTTNNMWRKSRKPNTGTTCIGTDLNRNFGTNHCGIGSSTNPCSDTYCGKTAFDNVETNNLKAFAEKVKAEGGQILIETGESVTNQ
jgi:murein tripeptide amidase MpaA